MKNSTKKAPTTLPKQEPHPDLGAVAMSKMGRDAGRLFVIVSIVDADYVLLADGAYHKLCAAKKKKRKHLRLTGQKLDSVAAKLSAGQKVFDSELYSAIKRLSEAVSENENSDRASDKTNQSDTSGQKQNGR